MQWALPSFCLLFIGVAGLAQSEPATSDPAQLLERAVEHRLHDESRSSQFTFMELWQNRNFGSGSFLDQSAKFESIVLDGRAYLRQVEKDGVPLVGEEAKAEASTYDSAIDTRKAMTIDERVSSAGARSIGLGLNLTILPAYFRSTLVGTEVVNGRSALILDCVPRKGIKPKSKEESDAIQFRMRVWIDEKDGAFARLEAELLRNRGKMLAGTTATLTWTPVDGVWLPSAVNVHGDTKVQKELITVDTEYTFSNYRRFRSDSRILEDIQPVQ